MITAENTAQPTTPTVLLSISNVEARYGAVRALRGVSLDVPQGGFVAILGANGAGKSTTLKTISGLVEPEKGSIRYDGRAVTGQRPDAAVGRGISHVPEGREVFPFLTVRENLAMGAFTRRDRVGIAADLERVYGYFPILRERTGQQAGRLSGGQQQMLAIARALLAKPRLILLDEPSLGLSPRLIGEIFTILTRINREDGVTLMVVEQNARIALDHADYGYVLELGRVVLADTAARLRENEDVREFYLGHRAETVRGDARRWKRRKTWR